MSDTPVIRSPISETRVEVGDVIISDESALRKWRSWEDLHAVPIGHSRHVNGGLVFAVAPHEWIVIGDEPADDSVDLTHVRTMLRLSGAGARDLLAHVCALDLGDLMTPNGSAARTLVAGVATELVRDDNEDSPAYLLLMSRSFASSVWDRLVEVAERR